VANCACCNVSPPEPGALSINAPRLGETRTLYARTRLLASSERLATCLAPLTSNRAAILLYSIAGAKVPLASTWNNRPVKSYRRGFWQDGRQPLPWDYFGVARPQSAAGTGGAAWVTEDRTWGAPRIHGTNSLDSVWAKEQTGAASIQYPVRTARPHCGRGKAGYSPRGKVPKISQEEEN
jgi:hypothetical protein